MAILFPDTRAFRHTQAWDIKEIKDHYPFTESENMNISIVLIKASNGKILQEGIAIDCRDRSHGLQKLKELKERLDKYGIK